MGGQNRDDRRAWEGEMFRLLVENVKDYAVFVLDPEGRVQSWSRGAERLLGYREAEIVGHSADLFFTPEDIEDGVPMQEMGAALAIGRGEGDRWHVRKDGSRFWSSGVMTPLRDEGGGLRGFAKIMRDGTALKRAEEVRDEALAYASSIVETVREPLLVLDGDLRVRTANHSFYRAFRASPGETEGRLVYELGNRQWDIPRLRTLLEKILPQSISFDGFEVEHDFPAIGRKMMLLNARRLHGAGNDSQLILLAIEDITERWRAEQERRELETRFTSLVKNIKDHSIFTLDPEGRITSWNIEAGRILAYSEAEALGQHFSIIFTPEDVERGQPERELRTALEEGRAEDERWHVRNGGERFWALGIVTPTRDATGRHTGYSKILRDMTDRKRAEQEIARHLANEQERSGQLREVARASLKAHSTLSLDGVLNVITGEARQIIGAHQAVSSMTINQRWAQAINSTSLSDKYAAWRGYDATPDGTGIYSVVCRTNQPMRLTQTQLEAHPAWRELGTEAGKHPPLRGWLAAPLIGKDGRNLGLIQLSDKQEGDFTEDDESILTQLASVASIAIENARLYEEVRAADRRKDEFLAVLAHELRNPMAPIRNASQLIRLAGDDRAVVEEARGMLDRQVAQMVRLIDDLLDVSRVSRNKLELRKEWVELAAVVQAAVETSRPVIDRAGHELTVTLPEEPVLLDADRTRLAQVFGNLLNNAAKYTPQGGQIGLTARPEGGVVVVTVRDNGIGIPADEQGHIFDMFKQVGTSLERSQGGLGIGLTLVKRLVEMHGGTVEVRSEGPGHGSEFGVRLPVVRIASGRPVQHPSEVGQQAKPVIQRRILVVDDLRDSADSLSKMLRVMGGEVRTAYDGEDAVRVAAEFRPEVVVLDIGMPKLNGYEAVRRIREQPWGKDITLIALTGWGQEEDRRRSQQAGFNAHLTKPADAAALEKLLVAQPRGADAD